MKRQLKDRLDHVQNSIEVLNKFPIKDEQAKELRISGLKSFRDKYEVAYDNERQK